MKTIPKPAQKYLKYLVFLGLSIAIAGLVAGFVSEKWSALPISLLVVGSLLMLVGLVFYLPQLQVVLQQRSTQVGTDAIVATLSVIIILGLINFLAVRYPSRIDLTETQLFTLSPQTQKIIGNLPQPLKVLVFDATPDPADKELLDNYRRQGDNFQYEFVDPQIKLGMVEKFGVDSAREVHLEYDERLQRLQTLSEQESLSEVSLSNGIERIIRQEQPQIYFLQGHGELSPDNSGENGLSSAESSLENAGYRVETLNLADRAEFPQDAAAIIVPAPQQELLEREVELLQDYLDEGGSLLLMFEPRTESGLEPLLEEWGVRRDSRLIIDGSIANSSLATVLVNNYGLHPITADFENGNSIYLLSEPLEVEEVEGIQATSLLRTSEQSWAESDLELEEFEFNPGSDIQGPLTIGYALNRQQTEESENRDKLEELDSDEEESESDSDEEESPASEESDSDSDEDESESKQDEKESRLVVFGNSRFATDGWFKQQLNGDVFLNSVKWLANTDDTSLSIRPKELKNRRLNLTVGQAGMIFWLAVFIVPAFGFAIAGWTWWRRR
ncbi:GldG family protein [Lusitaniella coriacea]|uniref:GldG family protein n=1 Tax=Lusitaniella coriacea TaxID=1983105 RepID=UPI003CF4F834